ncbi:MAG: biliverdin-producing heme oxygenase [Alphaproteobacteria bacterium]
MTDDLADGGIWEVPLSARLRARAEALRAEADRSPFVRWLTDGALNTAAYHRYLVCRLEIWRALERALLANADAPGLATVIDHRLFRTDAAARDLARVRAIEAAVDPPPVAAVADLVARIGRLARAPAGLAGHVYIQHFLFVFLGQHTAHAVIERLGLEDGPDGGIETFDFEHLGDLATFLQGFRGGLDRAGDDSAASAAILAEAEISHRMSIRLLEQLARPG